MAKILLDYVFPITVIENIPQASTAFLRQVCVVVKAKTGAESNIGTPALCTTMAQVLNITDNVDSQQLFSAGMTRVYILAMEELNLAEVLAIYGQDFFTVLISSDFVDADIEASKASVKVGETTYTSKLTGKGGNDISITYTGGATAGNEVVTVVGKKISVQIESGASTQAQIRTKILASAPAMLLIDSPVVDSGDDGVTQVTVSETFLTGGDGFERGNFKGVVGFSSDDTEFAADFAAIENQVGFYGLDSNGAKNMFFAFGSLLSSVSWNNQQYISMPFSDEVDELGEALNLFDEKVSFVIQDDEFSRRLALFAVGGKAIVAPYIIKDLCIKLQSRALTWINANRPQYTVKESSLLESKLQDDVIQKQFIDQDLIVAGEVQITLVNDNFVASGKINISEPKALWRVESVLRQTL